MRIRLLFLLCTLLPLGARVHATSVIPPDFSELVAEADAIYRGRVAEVQARRGAGAGGASVIKTFVTFRVERTLKGAAQADVTLEFLGGTIGEESLEVSGVPQFTTGERGIVFVQKNGRQFCPLVRLGHGRYRIERDAAGARDYIARDNRMPLHDVAEVALPLAEGAAAALPVLPAARADTSHALTPGAFEAQIVSEAQKAVPNARPN
jgi:hypothetical protein